jgi:glyoxalase family protein
MKLEGIHHVTAITGDARQNVEFYAGELGLRLVKKTVNQDDPTVYHLFYADELGSAGADITFFEYPGAARGRAGNGMVHRVVFRVGSEASLDFWEQRVGGARGEGSLLFADPEGLALELVVDDSGDPPLVARHPEIPEEHALRGFAAVRAFAVAPEASTPFLAALGFTESDVDVHQHHSGDEARREQSDVDVHLRRWEARGEQRGGLYVYDQAPPPERGLQGAGTVHHVAWAAPLDEHAGWIDRVREAGGRPTPVIDRFYFRSIYFREPSGVLFEIASIGPGFTSDELLETLGERLSLPPNFEPLRAQLEPVLTPLPNPRARTPA